MELNQLALKIFEIYRVSDEKEVPDWTIVQRPKLWHQRKTTNNVASMNEDNENSLIQFLQENIKDKKRALQILYQSRRRMSRVGNDKLSHRSRWQNI